MYTSSLFHLKRAFTLVELVIVVSLLGILAAVAIPIFTDFSGDARTESVTYIAGALNTANRVNKLSQKALSKGIVIATTSDCETEAPLLLDGGLPSGYTVTPDTAFGGSAYDDHTCTITDDTSGDATTFTITTTA